MDNEIKRSIDDQSESMPSQVSVEAPMNMP